MLCARLGRKPITKEMFKRERSMLNAIAYYFAFLLDDLPWTTNILVAEFKGTSFHLGSFKLKFFYFLFLLWDFQSSYIKKWLKEVLDCCDGKAERSFNTIFILAQIRRKKETKIRANVEISSCCSDDMPSQNHLVTGSCASRDCDYLVFALYFHDEYLHTNKNSTKENPSMPSCFTISKKRTSALVSGWMSFEVGRIFKEHWKAQIRHRNKIYFRNLFVF